ncbi:MAG: PrsW family glutamic-type intramembrane protease [Omnitrophica WOR_2 bacterium]
MLLSKKNSSSTIRWSSVFQLVISLLGIFIGWSAALTFGLLGFFQSFAPAGVAADRLSMLLLAAGAFLCGLVLLPPAIYALFDLLDRPLTLPPEWNRLVHFLTHPILPVLVFPVVLLFGQIVSRISGLSWLLLPPLHIFAVGLPVWFFSISGRRGLPEGSPKRAWGVFAIGLTLGPILILLLELFALVVVFILGVVYISSQPALSRMILQLSQQLNSGNANPEDLLRTLRPLLAQPIFIISVFAFTSVIVPLIEEAIKPIGVWFLYGRELTAVEGFTAGLLSGTGYALFENVGLTTFSGSDWTVTVAVRSLTCLLHILTAGLTGWGLVQAWRYHRYLRLLLVYLAAVLIHGLWNGLALVPAASSLAVSGLPAGLSADRLSVIAYAGMFLLGLLLFILLLGLNRSFKRLAAPEPRSENGANLTTD